MKSDADVLKDNPTLASFVVTLNEDKGDESKTLFGCFAEDERHAKEQALNAYPNGDVIHIYKCKWSIT